MSVTGAFWTGVGRRKQFLIIVLVYSVTACVCRCLSIIVSLRIVLATECNFHHWSGPFLSFLWAIEQQEHCKVEGIIIVKIGIPLPILLWQVKLCIRNNSHNLFVFIIVWLQWMVPQMWDNNIQAVLEPWGDLFAYHSHLQSTQHILLVEIKLASIGTLSSIVNNLGTSLPL